VKGVEGADARPGGFRRGRNELTVSIRLSTTEVNGQTRRPQSSQRRFVRRPVFRYLLRLSDDEPNDPPVTAPRPWRAGALFLNDVV
jgi:hypothetical protein